MPSEARNRIPSCSRPRQDTGEVALGYDAYVVLPDPRGPAATLSRYTEWSRRVQRLLSDTGVRLFAALCLATFSWLCERSPG